MAKTDNAEFAIDQSAKLEYTRRREARRNEAAQQMNRFGRVGLVRLAMLAVGLVLAWLAFKGAVAWWSLLSPAAVFFALAVVQDGISHARRQCERATALYDQALDRLDDRWAGRGATGERFLDASHPYAEDLALFGRGSLFELLSRARTRVGEDTLANWLLAPAAAEVVHSRQEAVGELRPR